MAMQSPGSVEPPRGLAAALRRLRGAFLATLHSRVELLAHELAREKLLLTRLLLLGIAALFFLALGAITATIFVIVLFWDSQRLVAIGFLALIYLSLGAGFAMFARREASRAARPFSATVEQFRRDREHYNRT